MTVDWLATLAEQGDIAKRKATEVATLVVKPDLPLEIASRLYREVEKGAQSLTAYSPTWKMRMSVTNC